MSHFSVVVIGENWEEQLAPYQEEAPRKYQVFEDEEEGLKKEFEEGSSSEFYCSSSSSWGQIVPEEVFAKLRGQPIGRQLDLEVPKLSGFGSYWKLGGYYHVGVSKNGKYPEERLWVRVEKIQQTSHPDKDVCFEGKIRVVVCEEPKEIPHKIRYPDFETFAQDWHGSARDPETGKFGHWTNPNAKWDGYKVGGRWSGFFKSKSKSAVRGEPGLRGCKGGFDADQIQIRHVDFEAMCAFRVAEAEEQYKKFYAVLGSLPLPPKWADVLAKHPADIDAAREEYGSIPSVKAIREAHMDSFGEDVAVIYGCTLEEFKQRAADRVAVPFAVVKDGKWFEKGSMGWWGCVSNAKEQSEWNREVQKLYASLPPKTLLTCVDCHI